MCELALDCYRLRRRRRLTPTMRMALAYFELFYARKNVLVCAVVMVISAGFKPATFRTGI